MATSLKVNERHRRTAYQFERWLARHSNADMKRKIGAFNAIADSEFRLIQEAQPEKKPPLKKAKKQTKRI